MVALDFGHARDFTVLILLQRVEPPVDEGDNDGGRIQQAHYHLRKLKRFALRTETPEVIRYVQGLVNGRSLRNRVALIADASGMGGPIVREMRRHGLDVIPLITTGGGRAHDNNLPKQDLISRVKLLLEQRRLKFSTELKLRNELTEEFQNFEIRSTANGNATYGAASGYHDDIIMAISFGCFYFERRRARTFIHATILPRATTSRPTLNISSWTMQRAFGRPLGF